MATQTSYYNLTKPDGTENVDVGVLNANSDIIDTELHLAVVREAENLAPIYDSTATYAVDDFCTFYVTQQGEANGYHIFKCLEATTGAFDSTKWEQTDIVSEMGTGGGGGGGHEILDDAGVALTQRTQMQFKGAYSADNSTDGITEVNVVRSMTNAEYEALTSAEKAGLIVITDQTSGGSSKFQPVIYSTEEREIGVWTDGKPLYEKTVIGTMPVITDGVMSTLIVSIAGLNIETVADYSAVARQVSGTSLVGYVKLTYITNSGNQFKSFIDVPNENVVISSNVSAYSNATVNVTIQYTKTTDTAGSGEWTPQGVPAVHYSTDEHIVGTYEGETLYEKNIDITLADSSDMQTFTPDNLGIGPVKVVVDAYFKNSGSQQLRMSRWYGNDCWSYIIGNNGGIMIKRNASDANWKTDVHFIVTVQYTKTA